MNAYMVVRRLSFVLAVLMAEVHGVQGTCALPEVEAEEIF
jgi:hypothetical protein